ncbi:MAG: hypothetical protein NVS9B12_04560 [Vulcanimicrobiaceae bacterium]
MMNDAGLGATAGAAGTMALDVASYLDMAIRGRSSSDTPAKMAQALAAKAGIARMPAAGEKQSDQVQNRWSASGALMGYAVGIGIGTAYGILRPRLRGVPWPLMGLLTGLAVMAATDVPATSMQLTDPKKWGMAGWIGDVVPHVAYGLVTAAVFESLA